MGRMVKILQSTERNLGKDFMQLWHGTHASPSKLAAGASTAADRIATPSFLASHHGYTGPGLYGSEALGEAKYFADDRTRNWLRRPVGSRYIYEVGFPKGRYLDWFNDDKNNMQYITDMINKSTGMQFKPNGTTGKDLFAGVDNIRSKIGLSKDPPIFGSHQQTAKMLSDLGVMGSKSYADITGEGINYSLFNPHKAKLMAAYRYGLLGAAGVGAARSGEGGNQ